MITAILRRSRLHKIVRVKGFPNNQQMYEQAAKMIMQIK